MLLSELLTSTILHHRGDWTVRLLKLVLSTVLSLAVRSLAAESTPLDEVRAAVALLADKTNYSWSATVDQNDGRTSSRASGGKFQKDRGIFYYMQDGVGAQLDVYLQGGKVAMKMGGTWKTFDEEFPDQRLRWIGRFKTPSAEASDLVNCTTPPLLAP